MLRRRFIRFVAASASALVIAASVAPSLASAALGPPCAHYENAVPDVWLVGDSITHGVEATVIPGFRYIPWAAFAGKIHYVGSQSFAGADNSLAANPQHEGHDGWTIQNLIDNTIKGGTEIYRPDVVHLLMGINDIIVDHLDAPAILARYSTALDEIWNRRSKAWMQIVVCSILKNLDPTTDAVVQAVNAGLPALIAGKSYASHISFNAGVYSSIADQTMGGPSSGYANETHPNDTGFTVNMGTVIYSGLVTPVARARPVSSAWITAPARRLERMTQFGRRDPAVIPERRRRDRLAEFLRPSASRAA